MDVLDVGDKVTKALAVCTFILGVFIDLLKACDTINHEILLQKLNHISIRPYDKGHSFDMV